MQTILVTSDRHSESHIIAASQNICLRKICLRPKIWSSEKGHAASEPWICICSLSSREPGVQVFEPGLVWEIRRMIHGTPVYSIGPTRQHVAELICSTLTIPVLPFAIFKMWHRPTLDVQ